MSRVVRPDKMSREQLIEALSFTTANDEAMRRVREYYSLLPTDELRARAESVELRAPDDVGHKRPSPVVKPEQIKVLPPVRPRVVPDSDTDKCRAELQLLSWVYDVTDIVHGVLGVTLRNEDAVKLHAIVAKYPRVTVLKKVLR